MGQFLEFLADKYYYKSGPNVCWLFGQVWKLSLFKSNWWGYFLGYFWKNLGYFLFQHLVTLRVYEIEIERVGERRSWIVGYLFKKCPRSIKILVHPCSVHNRGLGASRKRGTGQCDQIGRFIELWANFQCLWQQLFCPNLPHFYKVIEIFHFARAIIFGQLI